MPGAQGETFIGAGAKVINYSKEDNQQIQGKDILKDLPGNVIISNVCQDVHIKAGVWAYEKTTNNWVLIPQIYFLREDKDNSKAPYSFGIPLKHAKVFAQALNDVIEYAEARPYQEEEEEEEEEEEVKIIGKKEEKQ